MKEIKAHVPTKRCPHRWCRQMHRLGALLGATILMLVAVRYPLMLLGLALFLVLAIGISAMTHRRSMHEELMSETTDDLKPVVPLMVRPVWANIAMSMDIFYLLNGSAIVYSFLAHPSAYHGTAGLTWYLEPVGLGISLVLVWFITFAHKRATEPAKPILAPAPEAA